MLGLGDYNLVINYSLTFGNFNPEQYKIFPTLQIIFHART